MPLNPYRIEAENMLLTTYHRETGGSHASGQAFISLTGGTSADAGTASLGFAGPSGTYDVVIGYYDENDGVAQLGVQIGGRTLFPNNPNNLLVLDQNRGSSLPSAQTLVPRKIAKGLEVTNGQQITITGIENGGEPVRVDYIEFIPIPSSTLNGTDLAETLTGNEVNNTINAFGGNDTLIGKAGNDKLNGGTGSDTANYAQATRGVIANLTTGVVFEPLYNTPVKIMPLGDSITYGYSSSNDQESGGYRTYLWNDLVANSLSVDFVGSLSTGPASLGDKDHEGHQGWKIQEIASNINGWLDTHKPDIIPLMIGTNDTNDNVSGSTIANRLSSLIDQINTKVPDAQLLVSTILPIDGAFRGTARAQRAADYNLAIPGVVKSKVDQGKNVTFVDMRSELTLSDLADYVHPNTGGYSEISDFWYDAIIETGFDKDTLSSVENLIGSAFSDKLTGTSGNNVFEGSAGQDALTGVRGADTFVYRAASEGLDTITDFGGNDFFQISAAGFGGGLGAGTALSTTDSTTGVFVNGTDPTPVGTSGNFLYNANTGLLNFDGDGIGSGAALAIASLTGAPFINVNQFKIIS